MVQLEGKAREAIVKLMAWEWVPVRIGGPIHPSTARSLVLHGLAIVERRSVSAIYRKPLSFARITPKGFVVGEANGIVVRDDGERRQVVLWDAEEAERLREKYGLPTVAK